MLANALVQNGARVYITARKQPDCESAIKELSKFGAFYFEEIRECDL